MSGINNLFTDYSAPELYEQLINSPQYSQGLGGLFGDEDEEERKRRLALIGNYNQQTYGKNPQMNFGLEQDSNAFDMLYL
jgi:hypothetical protein